MAVRDVRVDEHQYRQQLGPIHPRDDMFTGSCARYAAAGESALAVIAWGLSAAGHGWSTVQACLDLSREGASAA